MWPTSVAWMFNFIVLFFLCIAIGLTANGVILESCLFPTIEITVASYAIGWVLCASSWSKFKRLLFTVITVLFLAALHLAASLHQKVPSSPPPTKEETTTAQAKTADQPNADSDPKGEQKPWIEVAKKKVEGELTIIRQIPAKFQTLMALPDKGKRVVTWFLDDAFPASVFACIFGILVFTSLFSYLCGLETPFHPGSSKRERKEGERTREILLAVWFFLSTVPMLGCAKLLPFGYAVWHHPSLQSFWGFKMAPTYLLFLLGVVAIVRCVKNEYHKEKEKASQEEVSAEPVKTIGQWVARWAKSVWELFLSMVNWLRLLGRLIGRETKRLVCEDWLNRPVRLAFVHLLISTIVVYLVFWMSALIRVNVWTILTSDEWMIRRTGLVIIFIAITIPLVMALSWLWLPQGPLRLNGARLLHLWWTLVLARFAASVFAWTGIVEIPSLVPLGKCFFVSLLFLAVFVVGGFITASSRGAFAYLQKLFPKRK